MTNERPTSPPVFEGASRAIPDGERVTLIGLYRAEVLYKGPPARKAKLEPPPGSPRTVSVTTDGGASVMLEVYYSAAGRRPADEVARFEGRRVRVVGTLHARTPTQYAPEGPPMQTMTGPYISVESIELV